MSFQTSAKIALLCRQHLQTSAHCWLNRKRANDHSRATGTTMQTFTNHWDHPTTIHKPQAPPSNLSQTTWIIKHPFINHNDHLECINKPQRPPSILSQATGTTQLPFTVNFIFLCANSFLFYLVFILIFYFFYYFHLQPK